MAAKAKRASAAPPARPVPALPPDASPVAQLSPQLSYAGLAATAREQIDALVQANVALNEGIEAIGREVMSHARAALEAASATARGLLGARTLEDVVRLQADLAKRNFDEMLAGSMKLSELGCALATEAFAPWSKPGTTSARKAPAA